MGLDSSGRPLSPFGSFNDGAGRQLLTVRANLQQTMDKAKDMGLVISKSGVRLQGMKESLPTLEAALKPLQAQASVQMNLINKIDRASEPAERVLETFEVVRSLERTLKGEPRHDLGEYLASLSQLEEAMDFLSHRCLPAVQWIQEAVGFLAQSKVADNYRLYRLNERLSHISNNVKSDEGDRYDMGLLKIALGKLDMEFRRLLADHSSPLALPDKMPDGKASVSSSDVGAEDSWAEPDPISLPPILPFATTDALQTIVERLNFHNWIENLLEIYKDCRLVTIKLSLEQLGAASYLHHSKSGQIDEMPWNSLEDMITAWCQHIEVACKILFKSERRLCSRVFCKVDKSRWIKCWGKLGSAWFLPFLAFGEAIVKSKIVPGKLFKLLDIYDVVERCHHSILEMFEGGDPACGEIIMRSRELQKSIVYRASETLMSFAKYVEEDRRDLPRLGERAVMTSYVMNYVGFIASDYGAFLTKVLRIHKRMEEGVEFQEDLVPERIQQIVNALEKLLVARSKTYPDPCLGYVFLMNNYYYMISKVKDEDSKLLPLLGKQWHKDMLGKLRQSTLRYQRDTWGKMLTFLNREGFQSSSGSRGAARELARQRLRNFTQAFDETCQKHTQWTIPSEELRGEVELAVTQMVVPAYRSYTQALVPLLDQATSKHMKYKPEDIERILENLFQISTPNNQPRNGVTGHGA